MRFSFGVICSIFLFLVPIASFSQASSSVLTELYDYVERTDSQLDKAQKTFYLEKFLANDHNYKEAWRYLMNGDRIVYFEVVYAIDSTEFTEVYYLNRGNLVCSEEYETLNYSQLEDELKWGGIFYFHSAIPRHVVTLGKRDMKNRFTNPETLALTRFEKRFSELKRHLPMLP